MQTSTETSLYRIAPLPAVQFLSLRICKAVDKQKEY